MDFRSQLSAFKSGGSSSANSGNSGGSGSTGDTGRGRGSDRINNNNNNSSNNNSNNYNRNRKRSPSRDHYNDRGGNDRGGGGYRDRDSRDRQRSPNSNNYHHHQGGPPNAQRRRFNPPPDLDGLGDLRNFGYRIPRGFPTAPTKEEKTKKSKHLALLVLTIEDLKYEHIWKSWCENNNIGEDNDEYFISVVCHAKYPQKVKSEWLRQRMLTFPPKLGRGNSFSEPVHLSRTPNWGSVEITRAMLDLLQDGLNIGNKNTKQCEDKRFDASRYLVRSPSSFIAENNNDGICKNIPPVDQFLFVSESCLPVVTASEFFSRTTDPTVSWLNASHRSQEGIPKNKYEDDQFACINRRVPGQYRWKGDQWVLLSRRHASKIVGMDRPHIPPKHQLWQSYRHINASDEMFFPTALALLGELRYNKDGHDTQKGRSRDEELSSQTGERGESSSSSTGVLSSPKKASNNEAASNDEARSTADSGSSPSAAVPIIKNECIILKPVTYTDWSQGMKNPALFTRGETDLKRVSKLARNKGCLMARKFATHISVPGIPSNEQKITGEISIEQWISVIKEIKNEEEEEAEAKKMPAPIPPTSEGEQEQNKPVISSGKNGSESAKDGDDGDSSSGDDINDNDCKTSISLPSSSPKATNEDEKKVDIDDNDIDEGEFQLE
jgi:hypothetical protein